MSLQLLLKPTSVIERSRYRFLFLFPTLFSVLSLLLIFLSFAFYFLHSYKFFSIVAFFNFLLFFSPLILSLCYSIGDPLACLSFCSFVFSPSSLPWPIDFLFHSFVIFYFIKSLCFFSFCAILYLIQTDLSSYKQFYLHPPYFNNSLFMRCIYFLNLFFSRSISAHIRRSHTPSLQFLSGCSLALMHYL